MPRLLGKHADGTMVVAVGGTCVTIAPGAVDATGRCSTDATDLHISLGSTAAVEPRFLATDEVLPDGLLSTDQIAAALAWEVGFVAELSAAEAELYLRYRPNTGDLYPDLSVVEAPDRPFSLGGLIAQGAAPTMTEPAAEAEPTLVVQLCAPMIYIDDLADPQLIVDAADDLIDRVSYAATVEQFYPALAHAVAAGALPATTVELAGGFTEDRILDFLGRLVTELDRRRPWPDPALVSIDPRQWPSLGASTPIGWVDITITDLEWAVKAPFADVAEDDQPLLVLRMRDGQLVALVGEPEPYPTRFLVLLPDLAGQLPAGDVVDYLARYAGLCVESDGLAQALAEVAVS
ncbi:hypothetical protein ACFWBG_31685 [Nocardia salmonicida]|uniref:hypothetical protein n=1 Tax=Nocardia salmonicida TaxID=53431 RepID=UPI00366EF711